ncbi:dehydrogenase with different specificitie [Lophiotrema nucula]|uniref:Dehydrogenase with different specificitie n=1 Tax=Lophiotrema nucula TaxID=690887 RepID=A0A6A5ZQK5_9PLEO|nr:dehydrogenase with different specificitie [Lophiotrema nucula]
MATLGLPLQGKVAIVTGSSRGLGAVMALELARKGANVTIVYSSSRSESKAKRIASQIESLNNGSNATIVEANVGAVDAGETIVSSTRAAFGDAIDILVNNAGVLFERPLLEITPEDYASIFDVNVRGPLLITKAVAPYLRKPGRVINISSVGSHMAMPSLILYSSSKSALEGLTRGLAAELGDAGHTVNAVLPGPTESDMLDDVPEDIKDIQKKSTPAEHRFGTAKDIADIVVWLASEESRWVTGQAISASGGYLLK